MVNIQSDNIVPLWADGEMYYIDSDLIYVPWFVGEKLRSVDVFRKEENKNDTVSISSTGQG